MEIIDKRKSTKMDTSSRVEGWVIYKDPFHALKPEAYEIYRLLEVAKSRDITLKIFSPEQFELIVTRDDRKSIMVEGNHVALPDFIMPRMGAGTTYFALAAIRHLEKLGVYSLNSSSSIETVKDKLYSHQILAGSNLPVPKTMLAKYPIDSTLVEQQLGFPVVVKTISGSQGSGVFLSENKRQFEDLMQLINATKSNVNIVLQEYVQTSKGRDLRVLVIGGRVIVAMERISQEGGFKANFSQGGEVRRYEVTPEIEWLAIESARVLGLEIAGIDLLFDGDQFKVCEANSSPGFEGLESCCDLSIPDQIYDFIQVKCRTYWQ